MAMGVTFINDSKVLLSRTWVISLTWVSLLNVAITICSKSVLSAQFSNFKHVMLLKKFL